MTVKCSNCTLLELKLDITKAISYQRLFELHLTGIETTGGHNSSTGFVRFELHLTGIETMVAKR